MILLSVKSCSGFDLAQILAADFNAWLMKEEFCLYSDNSSDTFLNYPSNFFLFYIDYWFNRSIYLWRSSYLTAALIKLSRSGNIFLDVGWVVEDNYLRTLSNYSLRLWVLPRALINLSRLKTELFKSDFAWSRSSRRLCIKIYSWLLISFSLFFIIAKSC